MTKAMAIVGRTGKSSKKSLALEARRIMIVVTFVSSCPSVPNPTSGSI